MKQLTLKKTGERVSVLGSVAKTPEVFEWRVTGKQQSGRNTTPRKREYANLKAGYKRVIIHHASHNEVAIVRLSALALVEVRDAV